MNEVTLYFRQGGSDKVYMAHIADSGMLIRPSQVPGFHVHFAYGRRGSTLTTGLKTGQPVTHEDALKIHTKLVNEKKAKGYTEGPDGTPVRQVSATPSVEVRSTTLPMLLNSIEKAEAERLVNDVGWCLQQKFDGRRMMVLKDDIGGITGFNKKGGEIGVPEPIAATVSNIIGSFLLDGEAVGDELFVFDILERDGVDLRALPYDDRLNVLAGITDADDAQGAIRYVETARSGAAKRKLWPSLKKWNCEGGVFKRRTAPYTSGRPNSGGNALKHKFVATASFIVACRNQKRSVELGLINLATNLGDPTVPNVPAGNVTIPPNHKIPPVGAIVEVRYLYAFPESGIIFESVYLGVRDDVDKSECNTDQLKFKAA